MTSRGFSKIWIIVMVSTIIAGGVLVWQNLEVIKFKLKPAIPTQPTTSYTSTSTPTFSPKSCTKRENNKKTSEDESKMQLTLETLKNAEYYCKWYDKKVQLKNGRYTEGYPDTISVLDIGIYEDIVTFGDLNNDGKKDAAVILDSRSGGGSGHFYEVAVVINQNGNPYYLTSELLGDRIIINSLTIQSGVIIIDMIVQGPNDGMCCPTMKKIAKYKLSGNQLLEVVERQ